MKAGTIAVVVIVVITAIYLLSRGSVLNPTNQSTTNSPTSQTQGIQNDSDLTSASTDLDNTDFNSVDNGLNQNDSDASNF